MQVKGEMIIGRSAVLGKEGTVKAIDPSRNEQIEPAFGLASNAELELACTLAWQAFDRYRETTPEQRAKFLETIADRIMDIGPTLIERAMQESGLPQARLEGERGRTCNQLRLFAKVVRDGRYLSATLDSALPDRAPAPRPDLRLRKIGLGPVAVFGASNFPLAFSVAGGDTASALAAGCPVVVKGHAAHPGTSELVGRAIAEAVRACGMPAGVFALLPGADNGVGEALVRHPAIAAVGFTGSRQGGLALLRIAQARPVPIPVYAEMSAINPVFLLPGALRQRGDSIATAFAASLTMGVGQLCTNPGLVLGLAGADFARFASQAGAAVAAAPVAPMLTASIGAAYANGVKKLTAHGGVDALAGVDVAPGRPALFMTTAHDFLSDAALSNEVFGPASLLVACADLAQLRQVAEHLEGQLTATLQLDEHSEEDLACARALLPILERKVGRVLANGFPTGVEVAAAMVHGGPFPATTDGRSTSVGSTAIYRFTRPVAYQNMPQALLAPALRDNVGTDESAWRLRDGTFARA